MRSMDDDIGKLNGTPLALYTEEQAEALSRIMAEKPSGGVKWVLELNADDLKSIKAVIEAHEAEISQISGPRDWPDEMVFRCEEAIESLDLTGISKSGEEGETVNLQGSLTITFPVPCVLWFAGPEVDAPHTLWVSQHVEELHKVLKLDFPGVTFTDDNYPPAFKVVNERNIARGYPDPRPAKESESQGRSSKKRLPSTASSHGMPAWSPMGAWGHFVSDARTGDHVTYNLPAKRIEHRRPKNEHGFIIEPSDIESDDPEAIQAHLEGLLSKLSRDALFPVAYVTMDLASSKDGVITIGLNTFADLFGRKGKMSAIESDQFAQVLHQTFEIFSSSRPWGEIPWKDEDGILRNVYHQSPIFTYLGPIYDQKPLPGMMTRPIGFSFGSTHWTVEARKDPRLLSVVGNIKALAQIPTNQPSGDWARSMGLAIAFQARINAQNRGRVVRISRRVMLTKFPLIHEKHDPVEILKGINPGYARTYWKQAIDRLKECGMVKSVVAPEADQRQAWKDNWMNEMIEVEMSEEWGSPLDHIQSRDIDRRKLKEAKKPKKKGSKGTQKQD